MDLFYWKERVGCSCWDGSEVDDMEILHGWLWISDCPEESKYPTHLLSGSLHFAPKEALWHFIQNLIISDLYLIVTHVSSLIRQAKYLKGLGSLFLLLLGKMDLNLILHSSQKKKNYYRVSLSLLKFIFLLFSKVTNVKEEKDALIPNTLVMRFFFLF